MSRIILTMSAPALALAVLTAGGGLTGTAAAQPVSPAYPVTSAVTATRVVALNSASSLHAGAAASPLLAATALRVRQYRAKAIAWRMLHRFGWRARWQFRYLRKLWNRESSWNVYATNPYSGAYGIPQAVPGSKMASAGRYWRTSPAVQIRWGLRYIKSRYGSPHRAWIHECDYGWY